jgi:hypothetical protein
MVVMESLAELLFNDSVTIFAFARYLCSMDDGMMKRVRHAVLSDEKFQNLTGSMNEAITPSSTRH